MKVVVIICSVMVYNLSLSPFKLFPVLELEPRDLFTLKKHPIIELHPQSSVQHLNDITIWNLQRNVI